MEIKQNYNIGQNTFKGVGIIQIPQKAFKENNVLNIFRTFDRAILQSSQNADVCSFLEQPFYAALME